MRRVWRRHGVRLACGVLGLVGVVAVLMLVLPAPTLVRDPDPFLVANPDASPEVSREPSVTRCYGVFELPRVGDSKETTRNTDSELNGVDPLSSPEAALFDHNFCERLRTQRVTSALLVAIPTVLLLGLALQGRRSDEDDYP